MTPSPPPALPTREELLPCPFCGTENPHHYVSQFEHSHVNCGCCGALTSGHGVRAAYLAVKKWNSRTLLAVDKAREAVISAALYWKNSDIYVHPYLDRHAAITEAEQLLLIALQRYEASQGYSSPASSKIPVQL
jgi:restriction alleviation protein Lar